MKVTITNRLAVLLRERQISSASEFGRRMTAAGFPLSSSHASRYEKESPPAFDQKFVATACTVLQCLPNDLYNITIELAEGETLDPKLAVPRHADVLVTDSKAGVHAEFSSPEPLSNSSAKHQTASKQVRKTTQQTEIASDDDTGPSGVLFPFGKPKD